MKKIFVCLVMCYSVITMAETNNFDNAVQELRTQSELQQQKQINQVTAQDHFFSSNSTNQQDATVEVHSFEELTTALLKAINSKNNKLLEKLLAIYRQHPQSEPAVISLAQANIELNNNEFHSAISGYENSITLQPDFDRAKLDLARLYFADSRINDSRQLFAQIDLPENPNIMSKVKKYQQALEKRESWSGNVSIGVGRVNNLNQSSVQTKTQFSEFMGSPVQWDISTDDAIDTSGARYALSLNKYTNFYKNHSIQFKTFAYGDWYNNQGDYNEHNLNLSLGYRYQNRQSKFSLSPMVERVQSGGKHLQTNYGLRAGYAYDNLAHNYTMLSLQYKKEHNQQKNLKQNNGNQLGLSATQVFALTPQTSLFGGISYNQKTGTKYKYEQSRRYGVFAGVETHFDAGVSLELSTNFSRNLYREYNPMFGVKQQDNQQTYNATVDMPRWKAFGFTPSIGYKHIINRSNADFRRSYKKNNIYVQIEKQF